MNSSRFSGFLPDDAVFAQTGAALRISLGLWSDEPNQARRFQGAHEAIALAHDLGIFEARVCYHFRDDQDDFTVPVRAAHV